ncbi:MAG: hypothetical protein AAF456_04705 [Planctomycetota bacterium]
MPPTIRRFGSKLYAQQLWCWGQDIEYHGGNLLMRFGFQRHRDRETWDRSTCYRLDQDQLHVVLWGFGMFFGRRDLGGLFLGRAEFCPEWAPVESISLFVHWPDELPVFDRPHGRDQWIRARRLWASLLIWISEYEEWASGIAGIDYRRQCVASWLRPFVTAENMVNAWQYLGSRGWENEAKNETKTISRELKKFTCS